MKRVNLAESLPKLTDKQKEDNIKFLEMTINHGGGTLETILNVSIMCVGLFFFGVIWSAFK